MATQAGSGQGEALAAQVRIQVERPDLDCLTRQPVAEQSRLPLSWTPPLGRSLSALEEALDTAKRIDANLTAALEAARLLIPEGPDPPPHAAGTRVLSS